MVKKSINSEKDIVTDFIKYSAVTAFLCGLVFLSEFLGSMTALFSLTPPILFYLNHKRLMPAALMVIAVAVFMTVVALSFPELESADSGLFYVYEFGALNVFLLIFLSRESDFIGVIFKSSLFAFLAILFVAGSLSLFYSVNLHDYIALMIDVNVDKMLSMADAAKLTVEQRELLVQGYAELRALYKTIYPALFFVGFEFVVVLNLFAVKIYFAKDSNRIDLGRLTSWSPDERWIIGLISFGFLYFVKNDIVHFIALNGSIVFLTLYLFSGFCIMSYFFKEKKVSALMQGIIYFSVVFVNEFKFIVIAIGAFNVWFDFRKKIKNKIKNENT